MNRAALADRKYEVLNDAANRWQAIAPEVARTAERLSRGGPQAANSRDRVQRFRAREHMKRAAIIGGERIGEERLIGGPEVDFEDVPPTPTARLAGLPVARLVELHAGNRVGDGFATGFVVAPGLLITNWHVFAEPGDAQGCAAQFGFERNASGLLESGTVFALDPAAFFLSDRALDIALVGIAPAAKLGAGTLSDFGTVRLIPSLGKILVGHPINIIQHPDGRHKHWAFRKNTLWAEPKDDDLFLTYTTDTLPGSSGSPSFNFDWELVAVHSTGVPRQVNGQIVTIAGQPWKKGMPDSDIDWVANAGARVSKVCQRLMKATVSTDAQRALLAELVGSMRDPVASGGGATGRETTAGAPPAGQPLISLASDNAGATPGSMVGSVMVHGTANFYFGYRADGPGAAASTQPPPQPLLGTSLGPVLVEKKLRFDSDYDNRPGYQSTFLEGFDVPAPSGAKEELLLDAGKPLVLRYHHFSLAMHKKRRLAMWTATNVDYDEDKRWRKEREEFGSDTWKPDPRIPGAAQIEDLEFYSPAKKFDRGHLVRRNDVAWGSNRDEEEFGNSDSFHWTNCTPQHEGFNRDMFGYKGLWGMLENHISHEAGFLQNRLIVFAGPILAPNDPRPDFGSGIEVQVPISFWKVIVAVENGAAAAASLHAYGFILDQTDAINQYGWEARFRAEKFKEQQFSLTEITKRSRVTFPQMLHDADPLANVPQEVSSRPLRSLDDVKLR